MIVISGYNAFMPRFRVATFITCYIGVAIYIVNILGWKLTHRTKRVTAKGMDLVTDRRRFEEMEEEEAIAATTEGKRGLLAKLRRRK